MYNIVRLFLFFLLVTSCMDLPVDTVITADKVLAVSGLLCNKSSTQRVFLSRGSNIDRLYNSGDLVVSDAEIILKDGESSYFFQESDSFNGEYLLKNWTPEGNKKYIISVKHKAYPNITAYIRFPDFGSFNLAYSFDEWGNLLLSWDAILNSYGYKLDLYKWKYGYLNNTYEKVYYWGGSVYNITTSTSIKINKSFLLFRGEEVDLKIIISAIDENYYSYLNFKDYYDPLEFHLIDYGSFSTVENGLGFIGSAYSDSLIINRDSQ